MARWYEEHPERLEHEFRVLSDAGFEFEVDEKERATAQIVLTVKCSVEGTETPVRVIFPWNYPYAAFLAIAPTLSLRRHQDPYSKALCFTAHIENEWRSDDTVGAYLKDRLPLILDANKSSDAYAQEAREGAPVTGYLQFAVDSVMLIGDWKIPKDRDRGALLIGLEDGNNPHEAIRGAVHSVRDQDNVVLAETDIALQRLYRQGPVRGRWVRLPAPPKSAREKDILAEAVAQWPELQKCQFNGGPDVLGIVFQDEARYREMHDIWIFLVRAKTKHLSAQKQAGLSGANVWKYIARADRAGRSDLQARVPRLNPLAAKKVALFGLGALGSMVAWQLARGGIGRLALVDHDVVESGTILRWLIGLIASGREKHAVLRQFLSRNYPYVDISTFPLRIGSPYVKPDIAELLMAQTLDGADMIVDCTVQLTVHHYLSTLAWRRGIPYVWASGTPGGWGGIVGRSIANQTAGCWKCFANHRVAGTYPSPAQEEETDVQPVGCFSPTFTGSGIDMDLISVMAARVAVATLCHTTQGGYPNFDWDIGIVDLWRDGHPIAPAWQTFPLAQHPDCDNHG